MAFGLSGSDDRYQMLNADVIVVDWRDGQDPRAIDYKLTSLAQVSQRLCQLGSNWLTA